ncbi:MAG: YicC family protein [Candidatus Omnitrophica bacterium]|nr:YicC family protein [Candidatus Omnitrophota bacterium]
MVFSMTGFGSRQKSIEPFGKISVEIKSSNHRFLEIVFHLPDNLLYLEDRIKKELEAKIKRGRLVCVISVSGQGRHNITINKNLLKEYLEVFRDIKNTFGIKDEISINTLVNMPGVLSLEESRATGMDIWPALKTLICGALEDLLAMRQKEGRALQRYLHKRALFLKNGLERVRTRFKKALRAKLAAINTDEERAAFLKDTDVSEELERLAFHIRNFTGKLAAKEPVGKELDFIAQEMQREANTLAAKSFDASVSGKVVQMKSQIEKIREQVQNIE